MDVVFVDFILKNVVRLLNGFEAAEATEAAEADENAEVVWDSKIASTAASKYSEEGHAHGRSADRLAQIVPRTYSIQEARPYGDITTQLLYPVRVQFLPQVLSSLPSCPIRTRKEENNNYHAVLTFSSTR